MNEKAQGEGLSILLILPCSHAGPRGGPATPAAALTCARYPHWAAPPQLLRPGGPPLLTLYIAGVRGKEQVGRTANVGSSPAG